MSARLCLHLRLISRQAQDCPHRLVALTNLSAYELHIYIYIYTTLYIVDNEEKDKEEQEQKELRQAAGTGAGAGVSLMDIQHTHKVIPCWLAVIL